MGWALASHLRTELPLAALEHALAVRALHQLLDLGSPPIDDRRPDHVRVWVTATVALGDVGGNRLLATPSQLRRRVRAPRQFVRLKNLHDLPVTLLHGPFGRVGSGIDTTSQPTDRDRISEPGHSDRALAPAEPEISCPSNRTGLSAYTETTMAARTTVRIHSGPLLEGIVLEYAAEDLVRRGRHILDGGRDPGPLQVLHDVPESQRPGDVHTPQPLHVQHHAADVRVFA